ncbi:S26 family signal peptidase [Kitasatospora sp. NPDC089797]|uniref:S26 family signal peptidase n=1 Tax=Kitasatospora sp. NPDC089797 TaxID=3155298 RepID=UPI00342E8AF9
MQVLLVVGGVLLAGPAAALGLLRAVLSVVVVAGPSMSPALRPGQRVLVLRRGLARLRAGRIVVVSPPPEGFGARTDGFGLPTVGASVPGVGLPRPGAERRRPGRLLVKRLAALPGDPLPPALRAVLPSGSVPTGAVPAGQVVLLGDNPDFSTDSRVWGTVPEHSVVGVVLDGVRLRGRAAAREPGTSAVVRPGRRRRRP